MNIWIKYVSMVDVYTKNICIENSFIKNIELRALVRSRVILVNSGVTIYFFQLSLKLIFASMNCMSCWEIQNLNSKNSYVFDFAYIVLYL